MSKCKTDKQEQGKKWDQGKLRFDLLPPDVLRQVVEILTQGAKEYGDRNWEQGINWGRVFAAAQRHQWDWWEGLSEDKDSGCNPLAHAIVDLMFLLAYQTRGKTDFDDRVLVGREAGAGH